MHMGQAANFMYESLIQNLKKSQLGRWVGLSWIKKIASGISRVALGCK
jgi:hypothetical protein